MPREVHPRDVLSLKDGISVDTTSHDPEDKFAATDLVETLKDRGVDAQEGHHDKVQVILMRLDDKDRRRFCSMRRRHLIPRCMTRATSL